MRVAGANERFPYSPNHSTYINAAASGQSPILRAHDPASYTPKAVIWSVLHVGVVGRTSALQACLPHTAFLRIAAMWSPQARMGHPLAASSALLAEILMMP